MKPPIARRETKITKIHGYELKDDYAWLRDRNQTKNPEIVKYLEAENAYTEAVMKPQAKLIGTLYQEMLGRIKQDDNSVPYRNGDYWYFSRTEEGKQYSIYLRSKTRDGKNPQILLDLNEMAKDFGFFSIGDFTVSEDGNFLAYSTDTTGFRQYTLHFKDLRTDEILRDEFERVTSVEWASDNKTVFLVTEDEVDKRSDKLWRHVVGTDKTDLILEEKDVLFGIGVAKSRDDKMLFLQSYAATMREWKYLPADEPNGNWKTILPREKDHEYAVDFYDGDFYITTNKQAENFRVVRAPIENPSEKTGRISSRTIRR